MEVFVTSRGKFLPAAFGHEAARALGAIGRAQPLLALALVLVWPLNSYASVLVLHLVVFAVTAMMCHSELARIRPGVRYLTSFYLWLAVGGAAAGAGWAIAAAWAWKRRPSGSMPRLPASP